MINYTKKNPHICFADSHIFFRVHLHLKQIPFASGLAQKQPPTAPNTIHDKRRQALFAEVQQSFFFPGVKTLTTVWTKISLNQVTDSQLVQVSHDQYHSEITECKWSFCLLRAHQQRWHLQVTCKQSRCSRHFGPVLFEQCSSRTHTAQHVTRARKRWWTDLHSSFWHICTVSVERFITHFIVLATMLYLKKTKTKHLFTEQQPHN